MVSPKSPKWYFMTDEVLRLLQILALVVGVGMFIQQAKVNTQATIQNTKDIHEMQTTVSAQGIVLARTVMLLDGLERRMHANEMSDAAAHERTR